MKLGPMLYLALALALSIAVNVALGWRLAGAKPRCAAGKATATVAANGTVRREEGRRDQKLDTVTLETRTDTRKAIATAQEKTNARAQAIDGVVVRGDCRRPAGLPPLDAAVDQANAATGD